MPRLGLTADEKKSRRRQYVRENRELWKALGVRMMSAPVHDDDRAEVLAELEVRRAMRMVKVATDKDAPLATIVQIGRRNLTPPASPKEMKEFLKDNENNTHFLAVEDAITAARKAHEHFRNARANIDKCVDEGAQQRLFAKEVAYGNLAAAWFRLAKVRAESGDPVSVFEARSSDV